MKTKGILATIAGMGTALLVARSAAAQEEPGWGPARVVAPRRAVEITFGTGFVEGFGRTGSDKVPYVSDFAMAGVGIETGLGFRFNPAFTLGMTVGYDVFSQGSLSETNDAPQGATASIDATLHARPTRFVHPYMQLGSGYRFLWNGGQVSGNDFALHGLELAKIGLGLDVQVARYLALGPKFGLAFDMFLWDTADPSRGTRFGSPRIDPYLSTGIQVRFDVPVTRQRSPELATR